jgi:hypothetical protein
MFSPSVAGRGSSNRKGSIPFGSGWSCWHVTPDAPDVKGTGRSSPGQSQMSSSSAGSFSSGGIAEPLRHNTAP